MPARKGAISIEIIGLTNSLALAGKLDEATRSLKADVADGMAEEIKGQIRSRSGALAASWSGKVVAGTARVASRGVLYGKASVAGSFVTPKRRRVLRFADGGFRPRARINPGAYVGKPKDRRTSYVSLAFQQFGSVCRDVFGTHFGKL